AGDADGIAYPVSVQQRSGGRTAVMCTLCHASDKFQDIKEDAETRPWTDRFHFRACFAKSGQIDARGSSDRSCTVSKYSFMQRQRVQHGHFRYGRLENVYRAARERPHRGGVRKGR
ncbi:unnamed protein product, partial [Ectocarpus fasciculatus]